MVISIDVQWSTPGSHSRTPKSYCPYSEGYIQALLPWGGDNRISVPGDQFYCLSGTSQKACCALFQSRQGSCFVYCVFSCNWQVKLSLLQVQKRKTEKLLYLVSRPSLSEACDKNRTPRDAASSHETASTSFQVSLPQWHSFISWRKKITWVKTAHGL